MAEKTALHVGFVIFCTVAVHRDTSFLLFIFRYCNGQFPGLGEFVIPQLQTCTALVLSAADCTELRALIHLANISCNF